MCCSEPSKSRLVLKLNVTMSSQDVGYTPAFVVDVGSDTLKAGFTSEAAPSVLFPSLVPRKFPVGFRDATSLYVPPSTDTLKLFDIAEPSEVNNYSWRAAVEHGIHTDWDSFEELLNVAFYRCARIAPEEHRVMLVDKVVGPKANREKQVQIMFETFIVQELVVCLQIQAALTGRGLMTGVGVDSGYSVTQIMPTYEGSSVYSGFVNVGLGGLNVTKQMQQLLSEREGVNGVTTTWWNARQYKENHAYVAPDLISELKKREPGQVVAQKTRLPDGQEVVMGTERFECAEILFNPTLVNREHSGLANAVADSVMKLDVELKKDLLNNIVLMGGNTMLKGFQERMQKEMELRFPLEKTNVIAPEDRDILTFKGCQVINEIAQTNALAGNVSAQGIMTKEEYDESGPSLVHRKCFW